MTQSAALYLERLVRFAHEKGLLEDLDVVPARNSLLDLFNLREPLASGPEDPGECPETAGTLLEPLLDHCVREGIIADTVTARDLMDARIMGLLMPRASETVREFQRLYSEDPRKATDWFYALSRNSNYIQVDRIAQNQYWTAATEFGDLEITVNLSKPEKDPKEIAAAKSAPQSGYPKCLLCRENAGFAGNLNHPARQNLRLIPLELGGGEWFLQYSPYVYYNEHCIVLNSEHTPMKLTEVSFRRLFDFVEQFPHYFIGSNADLPIVGGSILTHDHFQGGRHVFPMEKAAGHTFFRHREYPEVEGALVKWPMSVLRLSGPDREDLIRLSVEILGKWREYSDPEAGVFAYTGDTPHNTVTPIVRKNREGNWEADLVLRNNRTSEEHPLGIFHPHAQRHHIKKENIGLIEVMGLAVLPGRLKGEMEGIAQLLAGSTPYKPEEIGESHPLYSHRDWIVKLVESHGCGNKPEAAEKIIRDSVGEIFAGVLGDAGVYKYSPEGIARFKVFAHTCGFEEK